MSDLWDAVLARYGTPRQLTDPVRGTVFDVETVGAGLVVRLPGGRERRISEVEFVVAVPLLDRPDRTELLNMTFNSSYIRAIRDDLRTP